MGSSAILMSLGGISLGANFPIYGRAFEFIRPDDQGEGFRKVKVTLSGFLEGGSHSAVMALFQNLIALVGVNETVFTYEADGVVIHHNQPCWIEGYNEPKDEAYARTAVGDYSIDIFWFEDNADGSGLGCTYGGYTFPKLPRWSRQIAPNRETHRADYYGSTATITLDGFLYGTNNSDLQSQIDALQNAFQVDATLSYGVFGQSVRTMGCEIQPYTLRNFATFTATVKYDIGQIVKMTRKISKSRIHQNPVITEQPFCDTRIVELMNISDQTITYNIRLTAADLTTANTLLATEAVNLIIPGGIEMPGGSEDWDYDEVAVNMTAIKLYPLAVSPNLPGTGM